MASPAAASVRPPRPKKAPQTLVIPKNAAEEQKLKLERLMKNPVSGSGPRRSPFTPPPDRARLHSVPLEQPWGGEGGPVEGASLLFLSYSVAARRRCPALHTLLFLSLLFAVSWRCSCCPRSVPNRLCKIGRPRIRAPRIPAPLTLSSLRAGMTALRYYSVLLHSPFYFNI